MTNSPETQTTQSSAEELAAISFVGSTLAPLFLQDPQTGTATATFAALGALEVEAAAEEWPFADAAEARAALEEIVAGLAGSMTDAGFVADEELTAEYRRLFVGPQALPAPPWGSVYTDYEGVIFGGTTLALREWMRKQGVARKATENTPDDHIGYLLELMAWLANNNPAVLDEFLREHVLTWSSHYFNALYAAAEHPFYRGLAKLAKASLEGIQTVRGIHVKYPEYYR